MKKINIFVIYIVFLFLILLANVSRSSPDEKKLPDSNPAGTDPKPTALKVLPGRQLQILNNYKPAFSMKIIKPNPNIDYKILIYKPDPNIDYKILNPFNSGTNSFGNLTPPINPGFFKKFEEKKPEEERKPEKENDQEK